VKAKNSRINGIDELQCRKNYTSNTDKTKEWARNNFPV